MFTIQAVCLLAVHVAAHAFAARSGLLSPLQQLLFLGGTLALLALVLLTPWASGPLLVSEEGEAGAGEDDTMGSFPAGGRTGEDSEVARYFLSPPFTFFCHLDDANPAPGYRSRLEEPLLEEEVSPAGGSPRASAPRKAVVTEMPDMSPGRCLRTLDFWLLVLPFGIGCGANITFNNNAGRLRSNTHFYQIPIASLC